MVPKAYFSLFVCFLAQSKTVSSNSKASLTSFPGDKPPQLVDQTIYVNNWGLGKFERRLLTDIKTKLDSLYDKVSITGSACQEGWVQYGKSCFLIINIPTLKWSDARRTCKNLGGDLTVIRTAEENNFIFDLVKKQETITFYGVWLGFIRKSNNKFYWIDDTPLEGHYSPWGSGEPNNVNKNEYCSSMFGQGGGAGKWNDLWCTLKESQLKYAPSILCQKKDN